MMTHYLSWAARDVIAERERQQSVEGWTEAHDDAHQINSELSLAAACYAISGVTHKSALPSIYSLWPWHSRWWKPKDRRRNLVRAGALILAEIERLDRLPPP